MVYSLPGVEVTSDKPSTVKICHCDDVKRNVYDWVFSVTFEVKITNGQANGEIDNKCLFLVLNIIVNESNVLILKIATSLGSAVRVLLINFKHCNYYIDI